MPNQAQYPEVYPRHNDAEGFVVEKIDSSNPLEQADQTLEHFIEGGLPEAQKIADEYGVELDKEVKEALEDLEKKAKQAKKDFYAKYAGKYKAAKLELLQKVLPNARTTKELGWKLEWDSKEGWGKAVSKFIKKCAEARGIDKNLFEEALALAEEIGADISKDEYHQAQICEIMSEYFSDRLAVGGPQEVLKLYQKSFKRLSAVNFQFSKAFDTFASKLVGRVSGEILEKNPDLTGRSDKIKAETAKALRLYPEVLVGKELNPYFNVERFFSDDDRLTFVKNHIKKFGPNKKVARYHISDAFPELVDDEIKQELFESYKLFQPTNIVSDLKLFKDLFDQLPESEQDSILNKVSDFTIVKALKYFGRISEPTRIRILKSLKDGRGGSELVKELIFSPESLEKLRVSQLDLINIERVKDSFNPYYFLYEFEELNIPDHNKAELVHDIYKSNSAYVLIHNFPAIKPFLTNEEQSKVIDLVIERDPQKIFQELKAGHLELNKIQLKALIESSLIENDHHSAYIEIANDSNLALLHLNTEERYILLSRLAKEHSISFLFSVANKGINLPQDETRIELLKHATISAIGVFFSDFYRLQPILNLEGPPYVAFMKEVAEGIIEKADLESLKIFVERSHSYGLELPEASKPLLSKMLSQINPSDILEEIEPLNRTFFANSEPVTIPWQETYERILKLQSRTENSKYDPWITDLDPLVHFAKEKAVLNVEEEKDGAILYEFIRSYGMFNMPTLLKWHTAISKAKGIEDIPEDIKNEMSRELGVEVEKLPNKGFINKEILKFRNRLQADLLEDRIPQGLAETKIGRELFTALKGSTQWTEYDSLEQIIDLWKKTVTENPDKAQIPEGYREVSIVVPQVDRRVDQEWQTEKLERQKAIVANPEVALVSSKMKEAFMEVRGRLDVWWNEEILPKILEEINNEIDVLKTKQEGAVNEKASSMIEKQIQEWEESLIKVSKLLAPVKLADPEPGVPYDDTHLVKFIEEARTVLPKKLKSRAAMLRLLSANHQIYMMPEGVFDRLQPAVTGLGVLLKADEIRIFSGLLVGYINEHYLHSSQKQEHTRHKPFSKELLDELRVVWGVKQDLKKNVLVQAAQKLEDLERMGKNATIKNIEIALVPAKGLLRIYGGDIGDACYTSQHSAFAKGEYSGITAYTFVANRGTQNERLRGSFLVIETKTENGEPALVIRANNPQENLLGQVDADILIQKVIDEVKLVAKRRGIKKVLVPRDRQRSSCSNRAEVANYYQKQFSNTNKIGLVSEPETNFNGYPIWDSNDDHAVIEV